MNEFLENLVKTGGLKQVQNKLLIWWYWDRFFYESRRVVKQYY